MNKIHEVNNMGIDKAIEKGINHLISLNINSFWKGFPTLAGVSDRSERFSFGCTGSRLYRIPQNFHGRIYSRF